MKRNLISNKVHKRICRNLKDYKKVTKKELLNCLEQVYQEWEYIQRQE